MFFYRGDVFTIQRKGKALAQIVPVGEHPCQKEERNISLQQKELLQELNSLPTIGINGEPVELLRGIPRQKRTRESGQYGK